MIYRRKRTFTDPQLIDPPVKKFRKKREIVPIGVDISFNNPNGIFYSNSTNVRQVLSNLKNLLLTAKGERYFEPEFGTNIRKILFENITTEREFSEALRDEIRQAINFWLPYLTIINLDVNLNVKEDGILEDPTHALSIFINVAISGTNIYLPIRIFISETANIRIVEEAEY